MRKKKQRKNSASRLVIITVLALGLPVAVNFARANGGLLNGAGARAAVIAAAVNMPDGGMGLLKERFRDELYNENPQASEPEQEHNQTPDTPQWPNISPAADESSQDAPQGSSPSARPVKIPDEYAAEIISENFAGRDGGTLISFGSGYIKNETKKENEDIEEILETGFDLGFTDTDEPQVLLFHTHATESFERYDNTVYDTRNTWRSTDNNSNMVAVGNAMQEVLEENGVGVLHDTTQHDYPSYNGSYERSAKTVTQYLEEYPTIKVVLDLHRDAMERDDQMIVKPVAVIDGRKAAQLMIIAGCDDGTMNMPNWKRNLRFAAAFQDYMEQRYPDLTRPIYLCYRKYNMDISDGSLLLEFGSNGNTLEEAVYSAQLAGQALADLIKENTAE